MPQSDIVNALEIRDTSIHTPTTDPDEMIVLDIHSAALTVLKMMNSTDESIIVQFYSNIGKSGLTITEAAALYPDIIGPSITVQPGDSETRTLPWFQTPGLIYCTAEATVTPTEGDLTVTAIQTGKAPGLQST